MRDVRYNTIHIQYMYMDIAYRRYRRSGRTGETV